MKNYNLSLSKNKSNNADILKHLERCNNLFHPILSSYINLEEYALKLFEKAMRYEFFKDEKLIGIIALYHYKNIGYITNFSLEKEFLGKGLADQLMELCFYDVKLQKVNKIRLEVFKENKRAIKFYFKHSFIIDQENDKTLILKKNI